MSANTENGDSKRTQRVCEATGDEKDLLDRLGESDLVGVVLVGVDDENADYVREELDGVVDDAAIHRA